MPFEIATIPLESGARIGICPLPGRGGDLDADMIVLLKWGPAAVVSMTELDEMRRAGAADLPGRLKEAGIDWHHLPIRDYGGPSGGTADAWPALSRALHAILDEGGSVLTHCYGGHGRSGMVTLRLMTERGEDAEKALARIRAARPGCVEAPAQFAWAAAGARRGASGEW